jgi:RpiR family transcriptional regulator, carbohydrate utilization regulator
MLNAATLTTLRGTIPGLSPVLKRIGAYVVANPEAVIYHSVTELAEQTDSSEGSVIRFCRELGFSGFQEFKLSVAVALNSEADGRFPEDDLGASTEPVEAIAGRAMNALQDTMRLHDARVTDEVASRILSASRIEVYGVAASAIVGKYFAYKLIRLGLAAQGYDDPHLAAMSASNLDETAVAIGISSSGSTLDTIHALRTARDAGAFTVAVVNRLKSPIHRVAMRSLLASPPESPLTGGDTMSKISQMFLLEVLFHTIAARRTSVVEAIQRTARVVVAKSM